MADDALRCFNSLLESVPGWITELEGILKAATERQRERLEQEQPVEFTENVFGMASKTSSVHSRQFGDVNIPLGPLGATDTAVLREQMPHMTPSDALRLSQRKRKTASACSDRESAPVKYRSASAVVVYYDADVQKRFDTLVRAVACTRNSLRKGKMSVKVDMLSRTGSSSSSDTSNDEALSTLRKMGYKSTRTPRARLGGLVSRNDGSEAFDKTDGCLEKAQALCEKAAHQILRDGDCTLEVTGAKTQLEEAQTLGTAALPQLRKKAEKAAARHRREEERRKQAEADAAEEDVDDDVDVKPEADDAIIAVDPIYNTAAAIEIDVDADDSDGGDEGGRRDMLVTAMKAGRFRMRSTRLGAC